MKKAVLLLTVITAVFFTSCGNKGGDDGQKSSKKKKEFVAEVKDSYAIAEKEAQDVLVAYINKDLELLKSRTTGMLKSALDQEAMERPTDRELLESWDGKIKEIRYSKDYINFTDTWYARACFIGDPQKDEKLHTVTMKSTDMESWYITMNPLGSITSEKFLELSTELPE